ncbi:SET domain-containing protein, partial [Oryctes borbonicus]
KMDIAAAFENKYPSHLHEKLKLREEKARAFLPAQPPFVYHTQAPIHGASNSLIECACAKVTIRDSKALGRYVVATETIQIGEVVAVERPYAHVLLENCLQEHCYWCLKLGYSWKPCDNCVYAMFCSNDCYKEAWHSFHKYECPILATLYALEVSKLPLLALRIAIMARDRYTDILEGKYDNPAIPSPFYKSQRYQEIHLLAANTSLRTVSDLFSKAVTAAVIRYIVQISSPLHAELVGDYRVFDELVMRHLQTGPTNFHEISEAEDGGDEKGFNPSEIGAGAYAFLSLFNHSCDPNVVRHCHGAQIVVRAIRMIHKDEQLFDNYGYHYAMMKKTDRKRVDSVCLVTCYKEFLQSANFPFKVRTDYGCNKQRKNCKKIFFNNR